MQYRREEFIMRKAETAPNQEPTYSYKDKDMESNQDFKCDWCGRNFLKNQWLKVHVGRAHKSEDELENGKDKSL